MSSENSIWFRLGYALERARQAPATGTRKLATLKERRPAGGRKPSLPHPSDWPSADQLIASGAVAVVAKALDVWRPDHKAGASGAVKASVAGAAAALAVELVRPLLQGRPGLPELDSEALDRLIAGVGQGLVYGIVVEPRLPGPAILKGTLYGSAEYALDSVGGLSRLLGPHAPLKRVPVLGHLLDGVSRRDRDFVEHLAFGTALAVIYGLSRSRNGTLEDDGA
jgi:hypothetical protein